MKNQVFIRLMDGEELNFITNTGVETGNWVMQLYGTPQWEPTLDRSITIHLQNVAFHRHFKEKTPVNEKDEFVVHYKNGDVVEMLKWEVSISWDYLVCDTEFDATFIPMKNIKYHETF